MGGLGNQMFQYAFARSVSLKFNLPLCLDLSFLNRRDLDHLPNFVYRNYDLSVFKFDHKTEKSKKKLDNIVVIEEPHFHYDNNIFTSISKELYPKKKLFHFLRFDNSSTKDILLEGYWQSPKYFNQFENIIRNDFTFNNQVHLIKDDRIHELLKKINNSNSVMLNVRRTDYLKDDTYENLGIGYINSCISYMNTIVDNPSYYIFSDDIEWCRENIHIPNMTIVDHSYKGEKFSIYLQLMSQCKHFIIPNSTFAWWAAWLNYSQSKIVIAPKKWFNEGSRIHDDKDLIPDSWIRL
jgi:hypothetical protein